MKQYILYYNNEAIFSNKYFNACIGQAKFYYRHRQMTESQYFIEEKENEQLIQRHYISENTLKNER